MKKFLFVVMLLAAGVTQLKANDTIVNVTQLFGEEMYICFNKYDRVLTYAPDGCTDFFWEIIGQTGSETGTQSPVVIDGNVSIWFHCHFYGCDFGEKGIYIEFINPNIPSETTSTIWKHQGYPITLESIGADSLEMYDFHWDTGETTPTIEVSEPGIYTCGISDQCATATRTFIVRDNVELYRATCDLRNNLNQVTWLTTPAQAEYISAVKVYRNTYQLVATLPYTDGTFTDDIGSEATQWQYHLVGVDTNGNDCPIPSYWKRTIHLDHVQGTQGNEILQWTPYQDEQESNSVVAYNVYDVVNGEPRLVIMVGNFTNVYAYNPDDFDGYGTVAAVFASKELDDLAFSNLTADILTVDEMESQSFAVYPNPTNGAITVEGTKNITIFNTLGQAVATSQSEDGTHTFTLPLGIYFVKAEGGMVKKVVVE